jgi:pimeloyl-ACP methyl ester carboxylesterase
MWTTEPEWVRESSVEQWRGFEIEDKRVSAPGGDIHITLLGQGPALVLLHGITANGAVWVPVADELARQFQLVVIDLRGHGASYKPDTGYLLTDHADDLNVVLEHYGIDRPLIMGHSLGGMVALEWAIRFPDRAAALVIEDSPLRHGGPGAEEMFDGWMATNLLPMPAAEAWYRLKYPDSSDREIRRRAENITGTASGAIAELRDAMLPVQGASVVDRYAGITAPTLLIHGDFSEGGMVPPGDADYFAQTLANAETVRIPGAGHNLHGDRPEEFLAIARPFLERHASDASRIAGRD